MDWKWWHGEMIFMCDVWCTWHVVSLEKSEATNILISKNSCGLVGFLADISWEVQCTRTTTTTCILDAKKSPLSPTSSDTGDLRKSEVYEELYGKEATPCCCVASCIQKTSSEGLNTNAWMSTLVPSGQHGHYSKVVRWPDYQMLSCCQPFIIEFWQTISRPHLPQVPPGKRESRCPERVRIRQLGEFLPKWGWISWSEKSWALHRS